MKYQILAAFPADVVKVGMVIFLLIIVAFLVLLIKCYKKVPQGKALVRNGIGGTLVRFTGMFVVPIFHRVELMDISVKRIEIDRSGANERRYQLAETARDKLGLSAPVVLYQMHGTDGPPLAEHGDGHDAPVVGDPRHVGHGVIGIGEHVDV